VHAERKRQWPVFILFAAEEDEEVESFAPVFLLGN
jgi:hypothetical protein